MSIPLLITYAVGFCIIKYSEGYITLPLYGGTSTVMYLILLLYSSCRSRSHAVSIMDACSQKSHRTLVSLYRACLGPRNVSRPCVKSGSQPSHSALCHASCRTVGSPTSKVTRDYYPHKLPNPPLLVTNVHHRTVLLAVRRQRGAKAEGLVQQPVFQSVGGRFGLRRSVYATRNHHYPIRSPKGAVSFVHFYGYFRG